MENMMTDPTFWAVCVNAGITIFGFAIIKFNDFSHLEKNVNQISKDVKAISTRVIKIDKSLAVQTQRIDTLEKSKNK